MNQIRERSTHPASDPAFSTDFLAGLPPDLAGSFDQRQLFAIEQRFGRWNGVERRQGLRWVMATPWGRYACAVSPMGRRDRRAAALRGASVKGAMAGMAAMAAIAGGFWLL